MMQRGAAIEGRLQTADGELAVESGCPPIASAMALREEAGRGAATRDGRSRRFRLRSRPKSTPKAPDPADDRGPRQQAGEDGFLPVSRLNDAQPLGSRRNSS
jgi:hypothetical protein